jgi:hypothetical protein
MFEVHLFHLQRRYEFPRRQSGTTADTVDGDAWCRRWYGVTAHMMTNKEEDADSRGEMKMGVMMQPRVKFGFVRGRAGFA